MLLFFFVSLCVCVASVCVRAGTWHPRSRKKKFCFFRITEKGECWRQARADKKKATCERTDTLAKKKRMDVEATMGVAIALAILQWSGHMFNTNAMCRLNQTTPLSLPLVMQPRTQQDYTKEIVALLLRNGVPHTVRPAMQTFLRKHNGSQSPSASTSFRECVERFIATAPIAIASDLRALCTDVRVATKVSVWRQTHTTRRTSRGCVYASANSNYWASVQRN
jgi:hypothetical protein